MRRRLAPAYIVFSSTTRYASITLQVFDLHEIVLDVGFQSNVPRIDKIQHQLKSFTIFTSVTITGHASALVLIKMSSFVSARASTGTPLVRRFHRGSLQGSARLSRDTVGLSPRGWRWLPVRA